MFCSPITSPNNAQVNAITPYKRAALPAGR